MKNFVKDPTIVFMSIEEAKLLGANIINYTLDLDKDITYSAISFEYIASIDELIPIAIIVQPADNLLENITISTISSLLSNIGGYMYGSGNSIGILIPVENELDLYNKIALTIPRIIKQLLGKDVKPTVTGYSIETV
ncbi:MAG: hypothetical protein QXJ56_04280 [Ignisphaera sp.]|uniref:Uncharacterized protein n=1 Tax=Ignisphaera aggregans TaxID=334771 RepID=A0A7J3I9Q1_9CREN